MLHKTILICLLAAAFAKPADETTTSNNVVKASSEDFQECTTPSLQRGICVPYYSCKSVETIETSAIDKIANATREIPCTSYIDVCCLDVVSRGCGWRNPDGYGNSIEDVDENVAKYAEFPWMCAIHKKERINEEIEDSMVINVYVAGGSLIHPSVVLTAAHVIPDQAALLHVRAGDWDSQTTREPHPYQDREVVKKMVHDKFTVGNFYYDIALLLVSEPFDIRWEVPNVGLACLPNPDETVAEGTQCFATGWGKDKFSRGKYQSTLKKVEMPVVDSVECTAQLRATQLTAEFQLHRTFMCAGGEVGKDTCTGDGGSPLVCPIEGQENRFVQAGIVSWGVGCGEDGIPGVYTKVSTLRKWIDVQFEELGMNTDTYTPGAENTYLHA